MTTWRRGWLAFGLAVLVLACKRDSAPRPGGDGEVAGGDAAAVSSDAGEPVVVGEPRYRRMAERGAECDEESTTDRDTVCREACRLGHSNSCYRLGWMLWGSGDAEAKRRAVELFSSACTGGSGLGCAALAEHGGLESTRAGEAWRGARFYARVHCEQDHRDSCSLLAELYATSRGGGEDEQAAAYARRRACALGAAEKCEAATAPAD